MLYFELQSGKAVRATSENPKNYSGYTCRIDFKSMSDAESIADDLNDIAGEELFIATDGGQGLYPRWDVVRLPQIGDEVSYAFNGDYYPDGTVTRISESKRVITTSSGKRYYRFRLTGTWLHSHMWSLVPGHVDRRNPHF